ncbi:MAG: primosomal protein N' [Cyanobacteria bacterium J06638_22]
MRVPDSSTPVPDVSVVAEQRSPYPAVTAFPWVEALVDCPNATESYTYRIPDGMAVEPGDILSVPFGSQQMGALAVRRLMQLPDGLAVDEVRSVEAVVGHGFFPPGYWELLQRVATDYCTPLMQVVRTALPPGLLRRSQRRIRISDPAPLDSDDILSPVAQKLLGVLRQSATGGYTWTYLKRQDPRANQGLRELLQGGWVESYLEPPKAMRPKQRQAVTLTGTPPLSDLSPRQRDVLEVLRRQGGELWLQDLLQRCQTSSSVVQGLEKKGSVTIQRREVLRREMTATAADQPQTLTPDQEKVLAAIAPLHHYQPILLHGVTGSGKTEVYLQAIAPLLRAGKSALILVPEIGLTPQLTDRVRARFGERVLVYHSALSDGERYDTWRQMLTPQPFVVIGTRSAIFAPLHQLGVIVLDEEHDGSFKQDQPAPCYHARTVAQWRAQLCDCPLLLGSATPALESWHRSQPLDSQRPAETLYLSLPQRIHARPQPPIQVVDMRQELRQGNRSIFSRSLQEALTDLRDRRQQGLLFIHRRGHSSFLSCRACGEAVHCPHCDISLTYHQPTPDATPTLRCHYCGYFQPSPSLCPTCDSPYLKPFGSGTQRVVEAVEQQFPDLRCIRFDSDTTRTKGAHRALLERFAQGEAELLVGTQMLTKGIDLPQVTLVGVVAADGLLHLSDYRAGERAFQVLLQVAGRAGRGDEPGRVILQTYSPAHAVVQSVQRHQYDRFAREELHQRQLGSYPPYCRLVLLRLSGPDAKLVKQTATAIADRLRAAEVGHVLGPAPAAIARVARRFRWQILLKFPLNVAPHELDWDGLVRSHCSKQMSLTLDIDPLNFW